MLATRLRTPPIAAHPLQSRRSSPRRRLAHETHEIHERTKPGRKSNRAAAPERALSVRYLVEDRTSFAHTNGVWFAALYRSDKSAAGLAKAGAARFDHMN